MKINKKIGSLLVILALAISSLNASSDYNLIAEAVEYLIKQGKEQETAMNKLSEEIKKTNEANAEITKKYKEIKEKLAALERDKKRKKTATKVNNCDCAQLKSLILTNAKDIKKLNEKKTNTLLENNTVLKSSNSSSEKKLAEQEKRLRTFIKSKQIVNKPTLK